MTDGYTKQGDVARPSATLPPVLGQVNGDGSISTEPSLDPVEVMADRTAIKNALRPWADAYHFLERSGYNDNPSGTALMYNVKDPRFLGPCTWDLKPLHDLFERMVAEDGGSRL